MNSSGMQDFSNNSDSLVPAVGSKDTGLTNLPTYKNKLDQLFELKD